MPLPPTAIHGDARPPAPPADSYPVEVEEDAGTSHANLTFEGEGGVTLWGDMGATRPGETAAETRLSLHPDRPLVVGRANACEVPYLDPKYIPTNVMPGSGQPVLNGGRDGLDVCVSRGHFLLKAAAGGIVLVNGVPARGGGVRPPRNWTQLVQPAWRRLGPAEEYLIRNGEAASIRLPNGVTIRIRAG